MEDASTPPSAAGRPAGLRSILVGAIGVMLMCAITPFNDYVLNNTPLIGGSLPLAAVLFMFIFALAVNGPLSRYAPRKAFSTAEMTVILAMLLVACVMPASGLMQYWPATVVGPWKHMAARPAAFEDLLRRLNLPDWFWTTFPSDSRSVASRAGDGIVRDFYNGIPADAPFWVTFRGYLARWMPPTLGWGVFILGIFSSLLGISFVVRRQWIENERIPFPIAQVELALVETPAPRQLLNRTFATPQFMIGMAIVLALRLLQGLNKYFPREVPAVSLGYDLRGVLSDPPWSHLQHIPVQTLYPVVVALMFFASSRISLSLWLALALWQIPAVIMGNTGAAMPRRLEYDCNTGSILGVLLMILWTGRRHYGQVIRRMFGRGRGNAARDPFLHDGVAGWLALGGWLLASLWLMRVGMSFIGAVLLVFFLLVAWVVMAWAVAHSGFPTAIVRSGSRAWFGSLFPHLDPQTNYQPTIVAGHFHSQAIGGMWAYARDQLLVYNTHALKVATSARMHAGRRLVIAIVLALVLGFGVSHLSSLYCYYRYASTQDRTATTPINAEVLEGQPAWTVNSVLDGAHLRGGRPADNSLADRKWIGISFAGTSLCALLQLRYTWWPLHPIGLLMLFAFAIRRLWFSILVGWLIKVTVLRFGGASMFGKARPFFIGVIVGDVLAAGLFALLAILLYSLGLEYEVLHFLPTSQF